MLPTMTSDQIASAIVTIIVAIFGSTGFWQWRTAKKSKSTEIHDAVCRIEKSVDDIVKRIDKLEAHDAEADAKLWRMQIVRFSDEIRDEKRHSVEHYKNLLLVCDEYEAYCNAQPNFRNSVAEASIELIKDSYKKGDLFL